MESRVSVTRFTSVSRQFSLSKPPHLQCVPRLETTPDCRWVCTVPEAGWERRLPEDRQIQTICKGFLLLVLGKSQSLRVLLNAHGCVTSASGSEPLGEEVRLSSSHQQVTASVWVRWSCSDEARRTKLIYKSSCFHFIGLSFRFSLLKVLPPYRLTGLCSVRAVSQVRETGAGLRLPCQGWSSAPAPTLRQEREPQPCSSPASG